MTPNEFEAASIALLRSNVGWQAGIAARLGLKGGRAVRRWLSDGVIPDFAAERLQRLLEAATADPWPRDEWMIGEGAPNSTRTYICHLSAPRFVARIVEVAGNASPIDAELPADISSGEPRAISDRFTLCEITYFDKMPAAERNKWLDAAAKEAARVFA